MALSMIACCAPDWFRENITEDVRKGGLVDRIIFVHRAPTNRCYPIPPPLDPLQANDLAQQLKKWAKVKEKTVIRAQGSAKEWFKHWYRRMWQEERDRGDADPTVRTTKRQSVYLWKLSSLLSMSYGEFPEVTV